MAKTTPVASGFTANYTDPNSGVTINNAWLQMRQINYTPYVSCFVVTDVYMSQAAYSAGMSAVFLNVIGLVPYGSSDWSNYFDPGIMQQAGHDIQTQSLTWLQTQF